MGGCLKEPQNSSGPRTTRPTTASSMVWPLWTYGEKKNKHKRQSAPWEDVCRNHNTSVTPEPHASPHPRRCCDHRKHAKKSAHQRQSVPTKDVKRNHSTAVAPKPLVPPQPRRCWDRSKPLKKEYTCVWIVETVLFLRYKGILLASSE